MIKTIVTEHNKEHEIIRLIQARKDYNLPNHAEIEQRLLELTEGMPREEFRKLVKKAGFNLGSKYTPHQGSRERLRRLARIYHSHPHDCLCKSCEIMDGILKSRGMME